MINYDNQILKQAFAFPDDDEMEVAISLVDNDAKSILFLAPNLKQGSRTPDIIVDGVPWEIKTPKNFAKKTLERAFRVASKQSRNVIFYLKNNHSPDENATRTLKRLFGLIKGAEKLKIVSKTRKIIDFHK
jgi:hypothetical protein